MSTDDEYQAHRRREESRYLIAYEEWEASLDPSDRQVLGSAAVPDIEDSRSHSSRRVSLGVLTDAAERVSASYTPDIAEQLDGTAEDPSPELLAETLGITESVAAAILKWHEKAATRKAERIKMRAIVRIAGVFLDCANSKLTAAGLAYASDLAVSAAMGTMQDYATKIAVSRAAISKNAKFWQRELELPAASNMRDPEKCRAYSEAQKAKHWRNQKCTSVEVETTQE